MANGSPESASRTLGIPIARAESNSARAPSTHLISARTAPEPDRLSTGNQSGTLSSSPGKATSIRSPRGSTITADCGERVPGFTCRAIRTPRSRSAPADCTPASSSPTLPQNSASPPRAATAAAAVAAMPPNWIRISVQIDFAEVEGIVGTSKTISLTRFPKHTTRAILCKLVVSSRGRACQADV
jgi:hypothetical protein